MSRLPFIALFLALFFIMFFVQVKNTNSQSQDNRENILIILDDSNSMGDSIDVGRKIDVARGTINQVLRELPPNVCVGLRVFGHKNGILGFNACRASELMVKIGPDNQSLISNQLGKLEPVGWTPITYSLQQAVNYDFNGIMGKKRIILVTDGGENCDGSPCEYVLSLVRNNVDIKIDTIALDLSDPAAKSQLKCTALATNGKFYSVNTAAELANSLRKSINSQKDVKATIITK